MRAIALGLVVGCAAPVAYVEAPRTNATARVDLPDRVDDALPQRGVYVRIDGMDDSEAYVLDRDAATLVIRTHVAAHPPTQRVRRLGASRTAHLWSLAIAAWRDGPPPPRGHTFDHDETLAVADGNATFYLHGDGEITSPAAAAAIRAIVAAAD
jgi:hypothetical protein